jgi:hypothetical protein
MNSCSKEIESDVVICYLSIKMFPKLKTFETVILMDWESEQQTLYILLVLDKESHLLQNLHSIMC